MFDWKNMQRGWNNISNGVTNFVNDNLSDFARSQNEHRHRLEDTFKGNSSYSDFVSKANQNTDGWFSAIAGGLPIVSGLHNSILGRDSAADYLRNTGYSWSDIPGYNAARLTGQTSAGISQTLGGVTKIAAGIHDLGQFYSGDPSVSAMTNNMYG